MPSRSLIIVVMLCLGGHCPAIAAWPAWPAWVPVTDLAVWQADSLARRNKYAKEIELVCGGPPGTLPDVDAACARRSVVARLGAARPAFPLDINTGIHDGHTGSVPVSHAIHAFNAVAESGDRVAPGVIAELIKNRRVAEALAFRGTDSLYASRPVLMRRHSGPARLTVFAGGHDIVHEAALTWLEAQRRGEPAKWTVSPHEPAILGEPATASGR